MIDHRLVHLSSKEQELSNKWFQLLEERMNQNQYWTVFIPLSFLAALFYTLYYSLEMPFGYNLPADWLSLTVGLAWYLNRKNTKGKAWKILVQEGDSYSFSQVQSQLTQDLLPVRQSLIYGAILGIILFLIYQAAILLSSILFVDTLLLLPLALVLGQASSFLYWHLYNKGIKADLKLLDEIESGMEGQHS